MVLEVGDTLGQPFGMKLQGVYVLNISAMSKEMMKAGIIEEMMEDTFEGMEDQDELEDAAQEEVSKSFREEG